MTDPVKQVAIAILYQAGRYLLQLRDPLPQIVYPGQWGLFGGHLEANETPEEAVWRELAEEIGYTPPHLHWLTQETDTTVIRHVFYGPLTVPLEQLDLQEGWDCGLIMPAQIRQGAAYSAIAQKTCPIGSVHQTLILDFDRSGRAGEPPPS